MKSLSAKLGVVLIGLVTFGYAEVWGADWKQLVATKGGMIFYDAESIARPSKNIVRVWVKTVPNENGVAYWVKTHGEKYQDMGYSLYLNEFDCTYKKFRVLSADHYSKDGSSIESFEFSKAGWMFIKSESVNEGIYKALCK